MQTQRSCVEGKNGCFLFAIGSHTTERPNNLILVMRVLLPAFYNIRCLILLNFTREGFKTVTFSIHLNSESIILLAQRTSGNGYLISYLTTRFFVLEHTISIYSQKSFGEIRRRFSPLLLLYAYWRKYLHHSWEYVQQPQKASRNQGVTTVINTHVSN